MYNSVSFDKCIFSNIVCNGPEEATSMIEFISSNKGNSIDISNTIIENCKSNENLIKIDGVNPNINISNVNINNIISYGPMFNDLSLNVIIKKIKIFRV